MATSAVVKSGSGDSLRGLTVARRVPRLGLEFILAMLFFLFSSLVEVGRPWNGRKVRRMGADIFMGTPGGLGCELAAGGICPENGEKDSKLVEGGAGESRLLLWPVVTSEVGGGSCQSSG
jgi:hypothetical protein